MCAGSSGAASVTVKKALPLVECGSMVLGLIVVVGDIGVDTPVELDDDDDDEKALEVGAGGSDLLAQTRSRVQLPHNCSSRIGSVWLVLCNKISSTVGGGTDSVAVRLGL